MRVELMRAMQLDFGKELEWLCQKWVGLCRVVAVPEMEVVTAELILHAVSMAVARDMTTEGGRGNVEALQTIVREAIKHVAQNRRQIKDQIEEASHDPPPRRFRN